MKTSIIIVSYNTLEYTSLCIKSIRQHTLAGSYEIIVIDNNSNDGSVIWLQAQPDVKLICNKKNEGFPKACNQGIEAAEHGTDILLLNSDTIVTPRWLDQLQIALYSRADIGAVGCVTNKCSCGQEVSVPYTETEGILPFADSFNKSDCEKWEQRLKLVGFCFLTKRSVADQVGFLDEQFTPGNYEDDDYSLRIVMAGYKLLLCKDTFIHHFGSASFGKSENSAEFVRKQQFFQELLDRNFKKFIAKWDFSEEYGVGIGAEVQAYINYSIQNCKKILVLNCGCGDILLLIKQLCPEAKLTAFERNPQEARIAQLIAKIKVYIDIDDIFSLIAPRFDLIILGDSLSYSRNPRLFTEKIATLLNEEGILLGRVNNSMHWSLFQQSMRGYGPNYKQISAGMDCINYFSKRDVVELIEGLQYKNLQILGGIEGNSDGAFITEILKSKIVRTRQEAEAGLWLFMAQKTESDRYKEYWKRYKEMAEVIASFPVAEISEEQCRLIWKRYYAIGALPAELSDVLRLERIEGYVESVISLALAIYSQQRKTALSLLIEAYKIFSADDQIIYTLSYLLKAQGNETAAFQILAKYEGNNSDILQLKDELQVEKDQKRGAD